MNELLNVDTYLNPNGGEPAKKRGRKPGSKKIVARPSSSVPLPASDIASAVNTMLGWPEDIRKCAIAIVTEIGKS